MNNTGERKATFKGIAIGFLAATILLSAVFSAASASGVMRELLFGVQVSVNGEIQDFDEDMAPFIMDGRTFLPVRGIADTLGVGVDWCEDAGMVLLESPPVSFLSVFTSSANSFSRTFDRIDTSDNRSFAFSMAGSEEMRGIDGRPFIRIGGVLPIHHSGTELLVVIGNQAIYFHNNVYETRIIFTLLPNGNILVEEYNLDFGLSGEYRPGGMG